MLVRHARAALAEFKQAHEEVEALASGIAGDVRIGTTVTSATDLVPMAVARLNERHPLVRVEVELGFSEALVAKVLERKLDIAIARLHPSRELAGLDFASLGEEPHGMTPARAIHSRVGSHSTSPISVNRHGFYRHGVTCCATF